MFSSLRAYVAEPSIPDPPQRVWRDWALVGGASAAAVLEAVLGSDIRWPVAALAVALVTFPLLLVRRHRPLLAVAAGFGVLTAFNLVVWFAEGVPGGLSTGVVMLVNVYALYRWGSGRHGLVGAVVIVVAVVTGYLVDDPSVSEVIAGIIFISLPIEIGLVVRYATASSARRLEVARARERERLARDLHDTIAHHVSAIAIQAQAGKAVAATRPEAAIEVLDVIEREASRTLAEMRSIVGALRANDPAELAPQPGVADIGDLAARQPVRVLVEVGDGTTGLSSAIDSAIYRIAQEAVTNAVRHARRVRTIRITVARHDRTVRLTVEDDGTAPAQPVGGGYGLAGMAERATILGGTFDAGPSPTGRGWRVAVEIPVEEVLP